MCLCMPSIAGCACPLPPSPRPPPPSTTPTTTTHTCTDPGPEKPGHLSRVAVAAAEPHPVPRQRVWPDCYGGGVPGQLPHAMPGGAGGRWAAQSARAPTVVCSRQSRSRLPGCSEFPGRRPADAGIFCQLQQHPLLPTRLPRPAAQTWTFFVTQYQEDQDLLNAECKALG